ncbi:MAG: hypothetical protein WDO06_02080 [Actinomycetota bacterium]
MALAKFDGTALYEHEDPRLGEHPDWGTLIFNFDATKYEISLLPAHSIGLVNSILMGFE